MFRSLRLRGTFNFRVNIRLSPPLFIRYIYKWEGGKTLQTTLSPLFYSHLACQETTSFECPPITRDIALQELSLKRKREDFFYLFYKSQRVTNLSFYVGRKSNRSLSDLSQLFGWRRLSLPSIGGHYSSGPIETLTRSGL